MSASGTGSGSRAPPPPLAEVQDEVSIKNDLKSGHGNAEALVHPATASHGMEQAQLEKATDYDSDLSLDEPFELPPITDVVFQEVFSGEGGLTSAVSAAGVTAFQGDDPLCGGTNFLYPKQVTQLKKTLGGR